MASQWYCMIGDRVEGPLTDSGLRELARSGRLARTDQVSQREEGPWVPATRCRGLFDGESPGSNGVVAPGGGPLASVRTVAQCISPEEKKKRLGVFLVNGLIWIVLAILTAATMGMLLLAFGFGWIIRHLLAEYNVRKLQSMGVTATPRQFPEVDRALREVCDHFGVAEPPRTIILNSGEMNAFAIKFARKKVLVLLTPFLEGALDKPEELRFILGHELGHTMLDHSFKGGLVLYKPAAYKAARELTCDACGCAAAGDLASAKTALKRVVAGNELHEQLNEAELAAQAEAIYSGLTGWLLKQYLTYPPLGKRLASMSRFFAQHS